MKRLFSYFALTLFMAGMTSLWAQPATPAHPADPNQARPALPVVPDTLTPPQLETPAPAKPATSGTNAATASAPATAVALSIVADASLRQVLQELAQTWADNQDSAPQVPLTLTNAGTMRAKIEGGTVWDLVISPDVQDIKEMTAKGLLFPDWQRSLARNTVVIYGKKALLKDDELEWFDLIGNEWNKVAMGSPDLVASGRVAKRALEKHSLFDEEHQKLYTFEPTESLALGVVQREEADAVFVYKTDLVGVKQPGFDVFPMKSEDAPPVFYIAAVDRLAKNPDQARAFIEFCGSEAAKAIWAKYGFETN